MRSVTPKGVDRINPLLPKPEKCPPFFISLNPLNTALKKYTCYQLWNVEPQEKMKLITWS